MRSQGSPRGTGVANAPLIGRRELLDRLLGLAAMTTSESTAAILVGDPGLGKTRVLQEAAARLPFATRLEVVGYEAERDVPLASAAALLQFLRRREGDAGLGRILSLSGQAGEAPLQAIQVFEAAHQALHAAGRVLVTIDDLQWVDSLSLALIHYLVRGAATDRPGVMLLAASRPAAPAVTLADSLSRLLPRDRLMVVDLSSLTQQEGIELARWHRRDLTAAQAAELWSTAGGSPFWIQELTRGARAGPQEPSLVASRLHGLGQDSAAALITLAVGARPMSIDELALAHGWPAARLEEALAELGDSGVTVTSGLRVRVAHDLISTATVEQAGDGDIRRTHRRLAEILEERAGDSVADLQEALAHREAAGDRTPELAMRIAGSPHRRLIGQDGVERLARIAASAPPGDAQDLVIGVGRLASELGVHKVARTLWASLGASSDPDVRHRATVRAAREAYLAGDAAAARLHLAQCRAMADLPASLDVAIDAIDASVTAWLDHRGSEGRARSEDLLSAARRLLDGSGGLASLGEDEQQGYFDAMLLVFDTGASLRDWTHNARVAAEVVDASAGMPRQRRLESRLLEAIALRPTDLPGAAARFRSIREEALQLVVPGLALNAGGWLVYTLLDMGELEEARSVQMEVSALSDRVQDIARVLGGKRVAGLELAFASGDAAVATQQILAAAEDESDPHYRHDFYAALVTWLPRIHGQKAAGDVDRYLALARRDAAEAGCPGCSHDLELAAAEALARIGRDEEALAALTSPEIDALDPVVRQQNPGQQLHRRRVRALLASTKTPEGAIAELQAITREADALSRGLDGLWSQLDAARILEQVDRGQSATTYRAVAARAVGIGALAQAAAAERALRRLGVRTWRRGRAGGARELTARELEIAHLVASGHSNPEIADQLYLSRKTVERHVSNVLGKLGARNRVELASRIVDGPANEGPPG